MERFVRLLKSLVAGAQTARAHGARGTRGKTLVFGHRLAVAPLRAAPVLARVTDGRCPRGFTLVELMVSLVVAAILLGIGVPSYQQFVKNNRLSSAFGELTAALNVARSEATKRSAVVQICARSGDVCSANAADWKKGWIVYQDRDGDSTVDSDEILHEYTLSFAAVNVQHGAVAVAFNPAGDVGSPRTFYVCDDRAGTYGRKVEVASSGRVSVDPDKENILQSKIDSGSCV